MDTPSPPPINLKAPWIVAAGIGGVVGLLHVLGRYSGPLSLTDQVPSQIGQLGLYAAPLFLGILAGLSFQTRPVLKSLALSFLCIAVAAPLMREGLLCLIFILPVHLVVSPVAAYCTVLVRRGRAASFPKATGVEVLLLLIPFAAALASRFSPPNEVAPVLLVDSFEVAQSPETVWRSIEKLEYRFDQAPWLVEAMLPVPVELSGEGAAPGDERHVRFSNGSVLATVTRAEAPRFFEVSLSVEESGVEFFDHWSVLGDSRFDLEALPGGGTRITHSTHYTPLSFPRWYFEPAERYFGRLVQRHMIENYARQVLQGERVAGR